MPKETKKAIDWALKQVDIDGNQVTLTDQQGLVDSVSLYFNQNSIEYGTFSYTDLVSFFE